MSIELSKEYPHLLFSPNQWNLSQDDYFILGQCDSLIKAINNTPIDPKYYEELMLVELIKGAQSTTAIEGNTLTEEEIIKVNEGEKLPPSKHYQATEVDNILNAFNSLFKEAVNDGKDQLITPQLLLKFHRLVGKELGEHFEAIPGAFRTGSNNVVVGKYRGAEGVDVEVLIDKLCNFLRQTFKFESGNISFADVIIEAIVAHVYIEWIHPFSDGNGRTGRLVEFYILLRGGLPDVSLHILSNHYNLTRPQYYRELQKSSESRSLTDFIRYAIVGLRDGLEKTIEKIQQSQIKITWIKYIYDKCAEYRYTKVDVFKRRRDLALEFPLYSQLKLSDIPLATNKLAHMYSGVSERTLIRDLEELVKLEIITKTENGIYEAKISVLNKMFAKKKSSRAL